MQINHQTGRVRRWHVVRLSSLQLRQFLILIVLSLLLTTTVGTISVAQPNRPLGKNQLDPALIEAIKKKANQDADSSDGCKFSKVKEVFEEEIKQIDYTEKLALNKIYNDACENAKENLVKNVLDNTKFGALVGVIVSAVIGALIRDPTVQLAKNLWQKLAIWFYQQVAGISWVWGFSLNRYRRALREKYGEWQNPFLQNRRLPMSKVYIPLSIQKDEDDATKNEDNERIDIHALLQKHSRLMVTGDPGAGKTMLLRNLALSYAGQTLPGDPITIFLELNHLSDALKDAKNIAHAKALIKEQLMSTLENLKFEKPSRFLEQRLNDKRWPLLLLLDGLDEVNGSRRDDVVKYLRAFFDDHKACRAVITCRTQVYKEGGKKFDSHVGATLDVVPFNDQQIRRFLYAWKECWEEYWQQSSHEKSVEQLLQELRKRPPQIKELAKNPLLLTIIAYLYIKPDFVLPHSRAEFYETATNKLLNEWDASKFDVPNRFPFKGKQALLQHLALYAEDTASQRGGDRRHLDYYEEVIPKVREGILPKINVDPQKVEDILQEIMERSNLLVRFSDSGQKCKFTHLTLQEYFAAEFLASDLDGLLHRFDQDPNQWREVVKLWCGNSRDSTRLIQHIYQQDPLLAFEALADAKEVEESLANKIITEFQAKFGEPNQPSESAKSFGLVAADSRSPRGKKVFQFLEETLKNSNDLLKQNAAISALAHTHLPKAAKLLATDYVNSPDIRNAMRMMEDLAIPHLLDHARQGALFAIDDLLQIGTPDAAVALAQCLWHPQPDHAIRAAWCLAALLPLPGVTDDLRDMSLTVEQKAPEQWKFIWQPFQTADDVDSALPTIAQQIVYLLETSDLKKLNLTVMPRTPDGEILPLDPRLIVPLCTLSLKLKPDLTQISQRDWTGRTEALLTAHSSPEIRQLLSADLKRQILVIGRRTVGRQICQSNWHQLLATQPPILQLDLVSRLIKPTMRQPTSRDWQQIFSVGQYRFEHSWQFRGIIIIALLLSLLAVLGCLVMINQPLAWLAGLGFAFIPAAWMWLFANGWPIAPARLSSFGICGGFTFWQDLWRTGQQGIRWEGAIPMQRCFTNTRVFPVAIVMAMVGAVWVVLFGNNSNLLRVGMGFVALAISSVLVSIGAWIGEGIAMAMKQGWRSRLMLGVVMVIAAITALTLLPAVPNGMGWSALAIMMMGIGVGVWAIAPTHLSRWAVITSYPLFCGFPLVLVCLVMSLLSANIPHPTSIGIGISYGALIFIAIWLWFFGKSQEHKASNPFKDLPELEQYNPNPSRRSA